MLLRRHGLGRREVEAVADLVPSRELPVVALADDRHDELLDAVRDDDAARPQESRPRVVERGDDVLLEGIVAERLADDDVDALGRRHLGRVHLGDAGVGDAVVAQKLAGDAGNLGRLVEVDAGRAELGRQEAEEAGAGADVGNRGLSRDDDALQRRVKGGVADTVRKQRAMILDAHWLDRHERRDATATPSRCRRDGVALAPNLSCAAGDREPDY